MMPRARVSSRPQSGDAVLLSLGLVMVWGLSGCDGSPSRNILGSYFPSWMVCAIAGIAIAGIARMIFKSTGLLQELPVPFVVLLAIGCASTFSLWLLWLA
jgi:YtcA family